MASVWNDIGRVCDWIISRSEKVLDVSRFVRIVSRSAGEIKLLGRLLLQRAHLMYEVLTLTMLSIQLIFKLSL